jgi:hypothetical protein
MALFFAAFAYTLTTKVESSQRGQATVEYVVVVLAASLLAGLFIRWVNGTGKIGELLDRVIDTVIGSV